MTSVIEGLNKAGIATRPPPRLRRTSHHGKAYDFVSLPEGGGHRKVARFSCCKCGDTHDVRLSFGKNPTEMILKRAQQAGWSYKGRWSRWYCDRCTTAIADARKMKSDETGLLSDVDRAKLDELYPDEPKMVPKTEPVPEKPDDAPALTERQLHEIELALEVCYDPATSRYTDGYTDQRVADEIGLPVDAVTAARLDEHGDMAPAPEIEVLAAQVTFMQEQINGLLLAREERDAELKLLRNQVSRANPALMDELHSVIERADLPALWDAVRALRAGDVETDKADEADTTDRRPLRVVMASLDALGIPSVSAEIAALTAQMDGAPLKAAEIDLETIATGPGLRGMDERKAFVEVIGSMRRRPRDGVAYLPKQAARL